MNNLNEESLLDYLAHRYSVPYIAAQTQTKQPALFSEPEQDLTSALAHPLGGMELPLKPSGYNKKSASFRSSLKSAHPVSPASTIAPAF